MEITGIESVVVDGNFEWPLVRVDTDAGLVGYGEAMATFEGPDGEPASDEYTPELFYVDDPRELSERLERVLVGEDPTDVAGIVERIRPYGGWGRLGGGVSAVEMACWDIAGKHRGVPACELLGGRQREAVRVYCDCRAGEPISQAPRDYLLEANDYAPAAYADHAARREAQGFDFLKFDLDPRALSTVTGEAGVRNGVLTKAGLDYLVEVVAAIREAIDDDTDLGFDCAAMEGLPLKDAIRFGKAVDPYEVTVLEDLRPHRAVDEWAELTAAIDTPTITGENLYGRDGFRALIRNDAVDMVGPDAHIAGGIRETVKIADHANEHGMPANLHFAESPVGFMGSLHAAAAIEDLLALEFHAVGVPWWADLVERPATPFEDGRAPVPDEPGLGVELDADVVADRTKLGDGENFVV